VRAVAALTILAASAAVLVASAAVPADDAEDPRRELPRDASKLAKEEVAIQPRAALRGKAKTCCGYPLVDELGWKLTFYWLAFQEDFLDQAGAVPAGSRTSPVGPRTWVELYSRDGYFLARVPERFAWSLRMEGSGVMQDGRIFNYNGPCNYGYGTCFQQVDVTQFPYGRGAGMRPLIPFKSVAVDPKVIALGETLYLPELDGILLPDGSLHDGCVRADDVGGAIKRRKMDFFVVTYANYRFVIDQLLGIGWVTPQVQAPRCEYLRVL
jgi:3D (Asp-Asp-Asp) domain-containing protein